ncbi:MAG TPA: L-2-hydroxyglutarate oxidase [Thermoleophilaceae bacterium]|nr:L-2-hydroxyglutarate oxidase [Thermoleophilaceae bacterium]
MRPPPEKCDIAVVGAGIVGLAVARELAARRPGASLCVLEAEAAIARHQTALNSGVVHAGIYYRPGSLKARLCVEGARELYELCERAGVRHERCGKVIVARDAGELGPLDELERRGRANGVPGLHRLDALGIEELEPHCRGVAGLHSPNTGIVDFPGVARALAAGLEVFTGAAVSGVREQGRRLALRHARGETRARFAVFCAGRQSARLAVRTGAPRHPRIVGFRGSYLRLRRPELVRSLVYPVPDPALPFLGVHLTRHIDGEVLLGPTALPLGVHLPLFARHWRAGLAELRRAASPRSLVRDAAAFVPELDRGDVEPAFAGVRAQAVGRSGRLLDDFAFSRTARALHVRNAPSPAATSALAIARLVAGEAEPALSA